MAEPSMHSDFTQSRNQTDTVCSTFSNEKESLMFNHQASSHPATDAADFHLDAYNAAFYELGLRWHWDRDLYQEELSCAEEKERILAYLKTHQFHLLTAYDPEFLVSAIQTTKARWYDALLMSGGARRAVNWAELQQAQVGA